MSEPAAEAAVEAIEEPSEPRVAIVPKREAPAVVPETPEADRVVEGEAADPDADAQEDPREVDVPEESNPEQQESLPAEGEPSVSEPEEELSTRTPAKEAPRLPAKRPTRVRPEGSEQADSPDEKDNDTEVPATRSRENPGVGIHGALKSAVKEPSKPLTRTQQYLRRRVRSVLSYYYRRPLNNRDHDPWEVMHGMLSYGLHSRILDTSNRAKPVTAIGHLCFNKPCKRKRLMHLTPEGEIDAEVAYGVQGHRGQFLAMLAQCNVSPDYPIRIEGREFTIHDLIDYEMRTCYSDTELTFKLIALAHYLDLNETWTSDDGQTWSVSRLIAEERNQKIRGAPCGGTHRLSGLALAARIRVARGEPLDGEFLEAQRKTDEQVAYALQLQNRDGSLSTEWFRGRGAEEDINRRIRTTGHLLEYLLYALPEEGLTDSRTVRAVNYLTSLMASNTSNAWEAGPLSHALHALMLYDQRVFQPYDSFEESRTAGRNGAPKKTTLSYQSINSRVYGTYPSAEAAEEAREEVENPGGLRALFGIGRTNNRRSR